jgi:glycosyltransferase involved in cell wall biosynthesis
VGRLSAEKNMALFVSMAAEVAARRPETRFVVVGDGPERAALERQAGPLARDGRIRFAGARADVRAALGAMDLFVLTSDTEGLPNAVMEAMGAALPVVATRVGGTSEVVGDGETGRLVPPGRIGPLVAGVEEVLRDPDLARAMGAAGRERMRTEFGVGRMVASTRRLYEDLGARRGA